jgi:FKBP-type peptidyl-prolyl cis-trans isomerase
MKKITLTALVATVTLVACNSGEQEASITTLNNNIDSVSYAIGINSANGLNEQFSEGNMDAYLQGFKDAIDSNTLLLATEDAQGVIQTYMQKKQMEDMAKKQQENEAMYGNVKAEGEAFLADNATKEGVITTASGLQYVVLTPGSGAQPTAASNVQVHYHGTTPDGTVFDSSVERGQPIDFGLNQVIPGWTEGVQLMKEGAKYRFFIPQELAYGANAPQGGQGPIKPFMPLVFEVELIKVNN